MRDFVRLPVREGVFVGENGTTVAADRKVTFGAALIKSSDDGVEFFVAISAND
jgi:hypothetical protein